MKIRLDKSSYDRDQAVYSGNDGEEFYFARGREPKPADRKSANRVYDVEQNCNDGRYRLTFFVEGYDGATLYKNTNGVKSEIKEFAAGKCEYTETVKNNTEYCFLIIPFRTENGKRVYGEPVELQKIKYKKTDSLKPPENDWWIDE